MKITILGSGTDASNLPDIPNRYPPGFLVEIAGEQILFECSEGVRFRLEQAGVDHAELKHLAITHSHPDHFGGVIAFYQSIHNTRMWSGRYEIPHELNIYCPKQVADAFWKLWLLHSPNWPEGLPTPKINLVKMPGDEKIVIGAAKLSAFPVYHGTDKIEAVAYRLESKEGVFVYSGDLVLCEGIRQAAKDTDIFICEASARVGEHRQELSDVHMSPYVAGEIAKEAGVKKIVFFHYTGLDSDEAIIADCRSSGYKGEIMVGKDFQVFEI